jgi:hypothetical protein
MDIAEWAQYVAMAIAGAFGLLCLFDGSRRMVGREASGRGGRRAAIGILIVGSLAGYFYWQHWFHLDLLRAQRGAEAPRELPADWGKKMSPAKREAVSQNTARSAFISAGTLRQYFDISGQRKLYAPAQDDLKRRESVLAAAARLEQKADESFNASILWLILGLSAFAFGLAFALEPDVKPVEAEAEAAPPARPPIPPNPPAPAKPAVGENTVPLPKPAVEDDTVPLPKPAVGTDTIPLPKPPAGTKKT